MSTIGNGIVILGGASLGGVVPAGQYCILEYTMSSATGGIFITSANLIRYYGPGQTMASTVTVTVQSQTYTYTATSSVMFKNIF